MLEVLDPVQLALQFAGCSPPPLRIELSSYMAVR